MTKEILIIDMDETHLDDAALIERRCFPIPWSRQALEFELLYNELAEYVVALDGEQVVGYGGMWMVLNEAHITNIAVIPPYRRRGIGRGLLYALIRRAVALGADQMTLEVRPSNRPARNLYHSLGFVDCGRRRGYYRDNNEDAIIMWRRNLKELTARGSE